MDDFFGWGLDPLELLGLIADETELDESWEAFDREGMEENFEDLATYSDDEEE